MMVIGRSFGSSPSRISQGCFSIFMTSQLAFPSERKKSKLIMEHMRYISNFNNDYCLRVSPCLKYKICDLQSIKFYFTGATIPNDSTNIHPFPKRTRSSDAYRSQNKTKQNKNTTSIKLDVWSPTIKLQCKFIGPMPLSCPLNVWDVPQDCQYTDSR